MQLNLDIDNTPVKTKNSWAFAVQKHYGWRRLHRKGLKNQRRNIHQCIITACSKEAKQFGVRVGMRYDEAKARIPGLKILVCNW